jgi:hypothetical protein
VTGAILYYDGFGVTGTLNSIITPDGITLYTNTLNLLGSTVILGDGAAGFEFSDGNSLIRGAGGLVIDESLTTKSIIDSTLSSGTANQILSAGTTGGLLVWVNAQSGGSTGAPTATCASAHSTASQGLTANISENIQHDVVDFAYGITAVTGPSGYFEVQSAGVYKIIPSLQLTGVGNGNIHMWIKVNNVDVPNTTTYMTFKNGDKHVLTTEILLELLANDQVQVWTQASVTGNIIEYIIPGGTGINAYPAAPGVITNMYKLRNANADI